MLEGHDTYDDHMICLDPIVLGIFAGIVCVRSLVLSAPREELITRPVGSEGRVDR